MPLHCSVLTDVRALEALRPAWESLLSESSADEPMLSPLWILPWWRVFGPLGGRRLSTLAFHDGARLVGLALLCVRTHRYRPGIPFRRVELLGTGEPEEDEICSQYLDVIAARGAEAEVAEAFAAALLEGAAGAWDEICLGALDGSSGVVPAIAAAIQRRGGGADTFIAGASPLVELPATFPEYLARISSSSRYLVNRSMRDFDRWADGEVELRVATAPGQIEEAKRVLVALHAARWPGGGVFASPRFRAFHDAVMPALAERGALEIAWLTARGEPVVAAYNVVWGGRVYFYQSGRKLEVPRFLRPGIAMHGHLIQHAIAAGRRAYDFLEGEARYKQRLATGSRPLVGLRALRARGSVRERARLLAESGIVAGRAIQRALGHGNGSGNGAAASQHGAAASSPREPHDDDASPVAAGNGAAPGGVVAVLHGDLNMLRCFAGTGVRTVVLSSDPDDPSFFSRHCGQRRLVADVAEEPARVLAELCKLGRLFPERPVLFYGDDAWLLLASRHRRELGELFRFRLPPEDLVEALVDKVRFAEIARRLGLPVPRTVTSREARTAAEIARAVSTPCILKPFCHLGWRTSEAVLGLGAGPVKGLRADTTADLDRMLARIASFSPEFVVQEFVPGGEDQVYSFHAYLDAAGCPLGRYVGRKIRTFPSTAGVSTYLELVSEPALEREGLDVLARLGITGVAKLDYKRDPRSGRFLLLEVNPRYSLWNHLGAAAGVNLPLIAYRDLTDMPPVPAAQARPGVRWLSLADDARAFARDYGPSGRLSLASWLWSLRGPKVFDVFSWDDSSPFVMGVSRGLRVRGEVAGRRLSTGLRRGLPSWAAPRQAGADR
jgi:predicted ATP-grasp superfamily ATP-dependent carboligase/CelD/BcsL family acetyltransferase involved in cellulose biosynthesis